MTSEVPIQSFVWQQGEDLSISIVYKEGPVDSELAVNLVGWKLRMDIVDITDNYGLVYTFNSDDIDEPGVDQPGPADNEAVLGSDGSINISVPRQLTLPGGVISNRTNGLNTVFKYDIFLRNPANKQWPILRGNISVEKSYTIWR